MAVWITVQLNEGRFYPLKIINLHCQVDFPLQKLQEKFRAKLEWENVFLRFQIKAFKIKSLKYQRNFHESFKLRKHNHRFKFNEATFVING